jgi:hypothetical protein
MVLIMVIVKVMTTLNFVGQMEQFITLIVTRLSGLLLALIAVYIMMQALVLFVDNYLKQLLILFVYLGLII